MKKLLVLFAFLVFFFGCEQPNSSDTQSGPVDPLSAFLNKTVMIGNIRNAETNVLLDETVRLSGLNAIGENPLIKGKSITCQNQNGDDYILVQSSSNAFSFLNVTEAINSFNSKVFTISSASSKTGTAVYTHGEIVNEEQITTEVNYTFEIDIF